MALFRVRLEAQDGSGHFRQTTLEAADKAAAKRFCERGELRRVLYEMPEDLQAELCAKYDVQSIDDLPRPGALGAPADERAPFRELDGNARARLQAHYQSEPYKIVKVEEVA